jgi:hypothetical protein
VDQEQNTTENGYGKAADPTSHRTRLLRMWAKFYEQGDCLPTHEEAMAAMGDGELRLVGSPGQVFCSFPLASSLPFPFSLFLSLSLCEVLRLPPDARGGDGGHGEWGPQVWFRYDGPCIGVLFPLSLFGFGQGPTLVGCSARLFSVSFWFGTSWPLIQGESLVCRFVRMRPGPDAPLFNVDVSRQGGRLGGGWDD